MILHSQWYISIDLVIKFVAEELSCAFELFLHDGPLLVVIFLEHDRFSLVVVVIVYAPYPRVSMVLARLPDVCHA